MSSIQRNMVAFRHPVEALTTHETAPPAPSSPLPYDIAEMVIACLTHDLGALKACSLTCRSWSTAAIPHLHYKLTLKKDGFNVDRNHLGPLSELHKLGLLHLVKTLLVKQGLTARHWFIPSAFNKLDLRHFSTLTNVHTLKLERLQIYYFMLAGVGHYFGHFSQTLRSITLYTPFCTPRELSYFLSLFPNLDDIGILNSSRIRGGPSTPETELVPFSAPKMRGRLALENFIWLETWTYLITSCGGLRFRHMDLHKSAGCAPLLFGACAETLETLRLGIQDGSARNLDLSPLKVLRSLQVAAPVANSGDHLPTAVAELLSTITSPVFSELIITVKRHGTGSPWPPRLFGELRAVGEVRRFKLVFLFMMADIHGAERELAEALDSEAAKGLLDFLDSPPTIHISRYCSYEWSFLDFY